jgi:hypothetical protein
VLHPVTSHLLCYFHLNGSSSPKLLYACSLSPFEASTKTNHVSYIHRSNKVNILLNQ